MRPSVVLQKAKEIRERCDCVNWWILGTENDCKQMYSVKNSERIISLEPCGFLSSYYLYGTPISFVNVFSDLGITVDAMLKFHQHIHNTVSNAVICWRPLYITLHHSWSLSTKPILDPYWNFSLVLGSNNKLLESVQRRWTRHIQGLHNRSYSDGLTQRNFYSVKGRLFHADLIKYWKILHRQSSIQPETQLILALSVSTRGHSYKLFTMHSNQESRQIFLPKMHPFLQFFACPGHSNWLTSVF